MKKQIKKNKKITIDGLVLMVKKGFDGVNGEANKRFNQVDERFEKIDRKFNKMDERFDGMDERFDKMDERFDKMDERFDKMDERFDKMDERFDGMDGRLISLEKGQEEIKMKLDNVVYRTEFTELQRRIEVLEKTVGVKS